MEFENPIGKRLIAIKINLIFDLVLKSTPFLSEAQNLIFQNFLKVKSKNY